jgi:hypothetical protein
MNFVFALLSGDPLNPDPSQSPDPANVFHSPGLIGFFGTFILVVGALAIIWDMVRRIRRVSYKAQIQERIAAEQAEAGQTAGQTEVKADATNDEKPARTRPAAPPKPKR